MSTSTWTNLELEAKAAAVPRHFCKVGALVESLSDEDGASLKRVLQNGDVSHLWVSRAVKERGTSVSAETVRSHRAKTCSCKEIV